MVNMVKSYKEMVDTCDIKIVIEMLGYVTSMANDFGMFYGKKGRKQIMKSMKEVHKLPSEDDTSAKDRFLRTVVKVAAEVTDDKGRYVMKKALEMRITDKADFHETGAWILEQYGRNEFGEKIR